MNNGRMIARPGLAQSEPVDMLASSTAPSLSGWFRAPSPAYVPLSNVSFGPLETSMPTPTPMMPSPEGVRGGIVETFDKLASYGPVQRVVDRVRGLTRF